MGRGRSRRDWKMWSTSHTSTSAISRLTARIRKKKRIEKRTHSIYICGVANVGQCSDEAPLQSICLAVHTNCPSHVSVMVAGRGNRSLNGRSCSRKINAAVNLGDQARFAFLDLSARPTRVGAAAPRQWVPLDLGHDYA